MTQDVVEVTSEDIGEPLEKKVKVGTVLIQLQVGNAFFEIKG